ncbi:SGNH/GDSL hydrolase family protein [Nocardia gamkensis]|uniref:SGNH/GDSL hydrolase family protein n=1 Tax=Nocardia gamkensis TaxID=352869 RepID=UPI0036ECC6CF
MSVTRLLGSRSAAVLGACLATILGFPAATHAAPASDVRSVYVAMGDSFSAGVGIAPMSSSSAVPGFCLRSEVNYPTLVARALAVTEFRDVTCGGATTDHLGGSQRGLAGDAAAPQYDALTPDTTLVSLGIGGNDIGLVQLAASCINPLPQPFGQACAANNTFGGRDLIGERIDTFAPTYATVIGEIRRRAPRAQIVLVGYPTGIRNGGCPGVQPAWADDANYLQAKIDRLNAVMAEQADRQDAIFVDLAPSTRGHDACAPPAASWMVGVIPTSADALVPLHPNAAGHENTARQVLAALSN